jgi:hypothetical protein
MMCFGPKLKISLKELGVCRRKDLKRLLQTYLIFDPEAFCVNEQAGSIGNACRPTMQPVTGWKTVFKMKYSDC